MSTDDKKVCLPGGGDEFDHRIPHNDGALGTRERKFPPDGREALRERAFARCQLIRPRTPLIVDDVHDAQSGIESYRASGRPAQGGPTGGRRVDSDHDGAHGDSSFLFT